ncbi:MAG: hypothetical protein C7B46_06405 [Sulfobacillus benefaciens]|uniref:Nudix hydrolase domain-containing protein n=1 Tax=Sulfobacillus benefaciens TaxID=453960 RepID=A0A2T2XI85_9FIRM|nr:MAG: hypothetical protein C7B46_06405 [Sulfobacillus benefaciens]
MPVEAFLESVPDKVSVVVHPQSLILPPWVQSTIDAHWAEATNQHPGWFRGVVFTITGMMKNSSELRFELRATDYAHYWATISGRVSGSYACRVLYGAGIVCTTDKFLVFGQMGEHTAYPGRLQGIGGGLDSTDVIGDRIVMVRSLLRELKEEIGVDTANVVPFALKTGGPWNFVVLVYVVNVPMTLANLTARYWDYEAWLRCQGQTPEFAKMVAVPANPQAVSRFLADESRPMVDYLPPSLIRLVAESCG